MPSPWEAHLPSSPAAPELAHLQAEVRKRIEGAGVRGNPQEEERIAREVVAEYQRQPHHRTPAETPALSEAEVGQAAAVVLQLPPERHDERMAELLDLMLQKGVRNMLAVAERAGPHILDDTHRFLVAYLRAGYEVKGLRPRSSLAGSLRMTLYEVRVPASLPETEGAADEQLMRMVQLYAGIVGLANTQAHEAVAVEIGVAEDGGSVGFFVAVPSERRTAFEKMVSSLFPNVVVEEVPGDYNPFAERGAVLAAEGRLAEPWVLPLATYEDIKGDPLRVILEAFTRLEEPSVGAAFQLVLMPAEEGAVKRAQKVLSLLDEGRSLSDAVREAERGTVAELLADLRRTLFGNKEQKEEQTAKTQERNPMVRELVLEKIKTPLARTTIRLVASAPDEVRARMALNDLMAAFSQFTNPLGNRLVFDLVGKRRVASVVRAFAFRAPDPHRAVLLSYKELASLAHVPYDPRAVPEALRQTRSREVPLPQGVPTEGGVVVGEHVAHGVHTPVVLLERDRLRHLYVIGQTGTGKTSLLKNLIVQDIQRGEGVGFIDPHGVDVDEVLAQVPRERWDDVIYFDPANTAYPFGLNMLEYDPSRPEEKTFVVNELISIFRKLYAHIPESMGPAFEQYFRNAALLVMEDPDTGMTLLDIARVFSDEVFREMKLRRCKNQQVVQFWRGIALKATGEMGIQNYGPYITNKIDVFTTNDIMRPIIAQEHTTINIRDIMDSRKILLVNLSKGRLGDLNAHLIGLVLVGKFLLAALGRSGKGDYPPFYLYLDEFQNITTDSISTILSEARKYKLSLTIAHQFLKQLDDSIRSAVFGNVGSLIAFRVGATDAEELEPYFAPQFSAYDLANIDNYHAHVRLLANGMPLKPFRIHTLPPQEGDPRVAALLKQRSAERYGRPREEVEAEIRRRYEPVLKEASREPDLPPLFAGLQ